MFAGFWYACHTWRFTTRRCGTCWGRTRHRGWRYRHNCILNTKTWSPAIIPKLSGH